MQGGYTRVQNFHIGGDDDVIDDDDDVGGDDLVDVIVDGDDCVGDLGGNDDHEDAGDFCDNDGNGDDDNTSTHCNTLNMDTRLHPSCIRGICDALNMHPEIEEALCSVYTMCII